MLTCVMFSVTVAAITYSMDHPVCAHLHIMPVCLYACIRVFCECSCMCVFVYLRDLIFVFVWDVPTNPRHSSPYHRTRGQTSSPWPGRRRTRHSRCCRPSVDRSSREEQTIASTLNKIHVYIFKKKMVVPFYRSK